MKNINPVVYLLKIINDDKTLYKIGFTNGSVYNRIKNLQTGCPYKIEIVDTFNSPYSKVLELILHNMLSHKKTHGEWFDLDIFDEFNFKKTCEKLENIQKTLDKYKKDIF